MASNDTISNNGGTVVPYISWAVAVLSIVPLGFTVAGILIWHLLSTRWHKRQLYQRPVAWKPRSLRWPTLLFLLGLIGTFIILLESATLAFGDGGPNDNATNTTQPTTAVHIVVVRTDVFESTTSSTIKDASYTTSTTRPVDSMPPPSVGWLTTTARTTSYGAPKPSVGWLTTSPTPTSTSAPPPGIGWLVVGVDSWMSWETEYVVGTFLPTLLASIFAIPWKILDHDTKTLEPFAQLARPGGGPAAQTILLHYDGISGLVRALAAFVSSHHAPVALSTFLRYSAALLSPLAAESVRLGLQGACLQDWKAHCTATLRASESVILFTQVLLSLMGCAVFAYLLLMGTTWRNRGFGVYSDPRSIVGIASLSLNPFLSAVLRAKQLEKEDGTFSARRAARVLGSTRFELGYVSLAPGIQEYAILVSNVAAGLRNNGKYGEQATRTNLVGDELVQTSERHRFAVSGLVAKLAAFCLFLVGLIFLILWYRLAPNTDTAFEGFMDSQSTFGVRFLFTCFGVLVGFGWSAIFDEVGSVMQVWNMSRRPTTAEASVMMPLSPNPYVGLILYLRREQKLLALLSFTVILSDFLPIFLANVPFSNSITYTTFEACTWVSVAGLSFMLVVLCILAGSVLFRSSNSSIDVKTLGGVLHLACRSENFQRQLRGLSMAGSSAVKERIEGLNTKYAISHISDQDRGPRIVVHDA